MAPLPVTVVRNIFAFLFFQRVAAGFYIPTMLQSATPDLTNQIETADNDNLTSVESSISMEQVTFECDNEGLQLAQQPEYANCDDLINALRHPELDTSDREFCCTVLSSQPVRSACCHQVRRLCAARIDSDCPKPRRRILPPKEPMMVEDKLDAYNNTKNTTEVLQTSSSQQLDMKSKHKQRFEFDSYYKTKKSQKMEQIAR